MVVSLRSSLSVGLGAGLLAAATGAGALAPVSAPPPPALASPAVQLSAAVAALPQPAAAAPSIPDPFVGGAPTSPGDWIINGYNAIEPWVEYGVELGAWTVGWLPWPIGLAAPQLNIAYSGIEPVTAALVYSTAYLIDGQFDLIGPTITNGVQTGVNNFVQGEIAWIASYFPPLPPISLPVLPGAATAPAATARADTPAPPSVAPETASSEPVITAIEATTAPSTPRASRSAGRTPPPAPAPASAEATATTTEPTAAQSEPAAAPAEARKAARVGKAAAGAASSTRSGRGAR